MRNIGHRQIITSIIGFIISMLVILSGIENTRIQVIKEERNELEKTLNEIVLVCYSLEGKYPPNVTYMEQYYGVVVDHDKYKIQYNLLKGEERPKVKVIER